MSIHCRAASVGRALLPVAIAAGATPCLADNAAPQVIVVTGQKQAETIENAPSTRASVDAETIRTTVNAANVEDVIKYLPSLVVRKRHIGDTQSPLATRTSGGGASARSVL